jgi:hypothetical protein
VRLAGSKERPLHDDAVTMGEIVLLAFASAFWPRLIAITVIALQAPNPTPLLLSSSSEDC